MEIKINETKTLKSDLEYAVQSFFYDKTENANMPESAKDAIQERIELLLKDINNLTEIANTDVNDVIQKFSPEELRAIKSDLRRDY